MFKFIHTSDWHLGQNFYGYDRQAEQRDFLKQLAGIVRKHQPDALLVSGDIYHTAAPSSTAVSMYVESMLNIHDACPSMAIIVIAGNHDSAARLESDSRLWELAGVTVLGGIGRDNEGHADFGRHIIKVGDKGFVAAVPFAYPTSFPQAGSKPNVIENRQHAYFQALLDQVTAMNSAGLPVVLMAHLAVNNSDFTGHDRNMTMECVELSALGSGYDYAALGHIHRPQDVSERARYCGTPIAVSFDEQCEHSVSIVEIDTQGALPRLSTKHINNIKPLHTIPAKAPVALDDAIDILSQSPEIEGAYIRLNVLVDRYLPTGAQERVAKTVSEKKGRFCEIKKTSCITASNTTRQMTVEEFNSKSPLEIANQYFIDEIGSPMTEQEKTMFNQVYQMVLEENRQ